MMDAGEGAAELAAPRLEDVGFEAVAGFPAWGVAEGGVVGMADVVDATGAVGAAGSGVGARVALGVGNPAFCNVTVALPKGCPMKLGITKGWGEGSSATSKLIFGAETSVAFGGGFWAIT